METLVANLAGKTRRERWLGRDYLVAPLTLIVPGVMSGSKGPLYYPPDEVAREPDSWNHVPIVVYHPTSNGSPTTARRPDVLERQGVGYVFNAGFKGKLRGEGWFDIERTKAVDPRVLTALEAGSPFELSTGLYTDNEPAPGGSVFNSASGPRPYTYIARNYRPDHLAVLPDRKGACSVADGCGVLVNELVDPDLGPIFTREPLDDTNLTCPFYFSGLDLLTVNKFNSDQPRDSKGRWTPASMAKGTGRTPSAAGQSAMAYAALGKKADVSSHVDAIHTLRSRGTDLSKEEITAHINRLGRHLNKAQVHDVARATGAGVSPTKKDTLAAIHEHLSSRPSASTQQGGAKPYTPVNPDLHKASEIEIHKHFAAIKAQAQTHPKESRENAKEFLDKVESHRGKSYLHSLATDHGVPTAVNPGGKGMDSAPPLVIRNRILDKLFPTQASSQTPAAAAPLPPTAGTLSPTVPNSHAELAQATAGKQGFTGPFQRGPYTVVRHDDSGHTIEAEAGNHSGRFAVKDPSNVVHSRHDTAEAAVAAIQGVNRIGTSQGTVDKELRDRAAQTGKSLAERLADARQRSGKKSVQDKAADRRHVSELNKKARAGFSK